MATIRFEAVFKQFSANQLIERLVGGLSVQPYLTYLRAKYGEIYRLSSRSALRCWLPPSLSCCRRGGC